MNAAIFTFRNMKQMYAGEAKKLLMGLSKIWTFTFFTGSCIWCSWTQMKMCKCVQDVCIQTFELIRKLNTGFHFSTVVLDINFCTVSHRIHLNDTFILYSSFQILKDALQYLDCLPFSLSFHSHFTQLMGSHFNLCSLSASVLCRLKYQQRLTAAAQDQVSHLIFFRGEQQAVICFQEQFNEGNTNAALKSTD